MQNVKFKFRGKNVEICKDALASFRVQKALSQMGSSPQSASAGYDALDLVFCGKLDELVDTIPDENGKKYQFGAPTEVVLELIQKATEEAQLKNE